jgi:hypothetical protein
MSILRPNHVVLLSIATLAGCGRSPLDDLSLLGAGGASTTTTTATTGSTSTSTGGGGGTGGLGGQGGGIPTAPEQCFDGIDNDGDSLVDCEDPDCEPVSECVAAPPGLGAPYRVHQVALAAPATPCSGGASETFFAEPAGPAECSACSCGGLEGAACSLPSLTCFPGSSGCNGGGDDWTAALEDGNCHKPIFLLGLNFQLSCRVTSPSGVVEPGACPPSPVDFPNKAPWGARVDSCGPLVAGGGCGLGEVCVPRAADPGQRLCFRSDTAMCPAGTTVVEAFADGTDSRGCNACSCEPSGVSCTDGGYTFFDLDQCAMGGSDPPVVIDSSACQSVTPLLDSFSWSARATPVTATGSCTPSGGEPVGEVTPGKPTTYCCQ